MKSIFLTIASLASLSCFAGEYDWDLTPLFANEAAWRLECQKIEKASPELKKCAGHLGDSAKRLKACLDQMFSIQMRTERVNVWAHLNKAVNQKASVTEKNAQLVKDLVGKVDENAAFISPEIVKIGRGKIDSFLNALHELSIYKQFLRVNLDQAEHILNTEKEELLATLSPIINGGEPMQNILFSADVPWGSVAFKDGKSQVINETGYTKFRAAPDREERRLVFESFYHTLKQYERTLGMNLTNTVKTHTIMAKVRHYKSALDAALDGDKVPAQVYRTLVEQAHKGLPTFQKYLKLQEQALHIAHQEYYDAYASGEAMKVDFPIEKTKQLVLAALAPLGPDYVATLKKAIESHWMDLYPKDGKENGAFMSAEAYEVHPFVLLNHQDNFESASTFAHEWGHAMHSVLADRAQPYASSDYPIFLAEIASTTNEILLVEYLIQYAKDNKEKAFYLEELLKMIRGTYFRQTQFAEFELALHEEVESGRALTGERISEIYGKIARQFYGHDRGVMNIDPQYFTEWVYVPHFYYNFYVYKYATSFVAAFHFAEAILHNEPGALGRYLNVLKAGASKYPTEVLNDAGVDMTSADVHKALLKRASEAVDQLAALRK